MKIFQPVQKKLRNFHRGRLAAVVIALSLCALGLFSPGCSALSQQTPAQKLYDAETALDTLVVGLNTAHDAALISTSDEQQLAPYVDAANAAIASLQSAVAANDSSATAAALQAFDAALVQFNTAKANLKPATAPTLAMPTTSEK